MVQHTDRVSLRVAAEALQTDYHTLDRWMERAGIDPVAPDPHANDLRPRTISRDELEALATLHHRVLLIDDESPRTLAAALKVIARQATEIAALRDQVTRYEQERISVKAYQKRQEGQETVLDHQVMDSSSKPIQSSSRPVATLPDGLVSVEGFAARHGWPLQTIRKAIETGRISETIGAWKVPRNTVKHALDRDQQRAMLATYRHHERFHECDDPMCLCHERG